MRAGAHRAYEDVSLPGGKPVACVDGDSAYRRRRVPVVERLLHALAPAIRRRGSRPTGRLAGVILAVGNDRPAVIAARLDDVDLVAAHGPVLGFPDLTRLRVDEEPDRVANPERIDLGPVPRDADERVVLRDRAIVVQAQNLSRVIRRILRIVA